MASLSIDNSVLQGYVGKDKIVSLIDPQRSPALFAQEIVSKIAGSFLYLNNPYKWSSTSQIDDRTLTMRQVTLSSRAMNAALHSPQNCLGELRYVINRRQFTRVIMSNITVELSKFGIIDLDVATYQRPITLKRAMIDYVFSRFRNKERYERISAATITLKPLIALTNGYIVTAHSEIGQPVEVVFE